MSRTVQHTCDSCGKAITDANPIIAKLYFSPVVKSRARTDHGAYTRHADIGLCCSTRIVKGINWSARQTREDYQNGRRLRPRTNGSVGTRKAATPVKKK